MKGYRLILDTDIGDDIDDSFALALLLRCPQFDLAGVTTVFGDAGRRAAAVRELLDADRREVTLLAGCDGTFASRPQPGDIGRRYLYGPERAGRAYEPGAAVRLLASTDASLILPIGPMTNLAAALAVRPGAFAGKRIVAMAGEFQLPQFVEHNVRCDPEAAHLVFASGVPMDVIPWSIGPATQLTPADLERLGGSHKPLARKLMDHVRQFHRHSPGKTNMYDPMTVVSLLRPDLFDWRQGRVTVELKDDKLYALTRFQPDDAGPHRVAMGVRGDEAKAVMLERLLKEG